MPVFVPSAGKKGKTNIKVNAISLSGMMGRLIKLGRLKNYFNMYD